MEKYPNNNGQGILPDGLLPDVAAALGISMDDGEVNKMTADARNAMADVSFSHTESTHQNTTNRSASSAAVAKEAPHYGSQHQYTHASTHSSPHRRTQSTPPEAHQPQQYTPYVHAEPRSQSARPFPLNSPPSVRAEPLNASPPVHVQQVYPMQAPMAQAVPVPESDEPDQSTSGVLYHKNVPLTKHQIDQLRGLGYSEGLISGLNELKERMPLRFWLVDNSGSMLTSDGYELRGHASQTQPYSVECTRWVELQSTVEWHASLAGVLGTHTVFRLLNTPENMPSVHEFVVADPAHPDRSARESVEHAKEIMNKVVPKGFTPLTKHLQQIRESVASVEQTLRSRSQQAVIVIATDGKPTDEMGDSTESALAEFRKVLKAMQNLPLWVVIRLCTDDKDVVSYYNSLDGQLELSIEVIDDYFHEAKQVNQNNPWLNYAMPLHRCREMGFHPRVFDLLDERLLNKDELLEFLKLVFGDAVILKAPDIHTEWKKFTAFLQALLDLEMQHYNPRTKKMCQWIDMTQLNRCYGSGIFTNRFRRSKKG